MKLLAQIKKDIDFNRNLYNLVEVLKEVAISQYHTLEKKMKSFEKIFVNIEDLFSMIDVESSAHPLINTGSRTPAVIAVTSDAGLLGGLNMQVMNLALKEVEENKAALIIVGEKGQVYAASENTVDFTAFPGIKDETRFSQAQELRDYIIQEELKEKLGTVKIIYPFAISAIAQKIQSLVLIPFTKPVNQAQGVAVPLDEIIMESKVEDTVGYLAYLYLGHRLNEIFGFSRLAELSARFSHLENSKTKIEEQNKMLRLQYFRQRHELIDKNIREIFATKLAFK
jgi:ATP synthase F1 gamma subunit